MARNKRCAWRAAFLRALRASGNVKLAAGTAGVDRSTAYLARRAEAGFAAKWAEAVKNAKEAPSPRCRRSRAGSIAPPERSWTAGGSPPRLPLRNGGEEPAGRELVVRVSKRHGRQLVKASAGRWSARVETIFLAALRQTGCVAAAAHACGLSTTALYNRRKKDEDFRLRWREAGEEADERLPGLLTAAAIAALDPEIDAADLPPCSVRDAIHICRMKGLGTPAARELERRRAGPRVATNAEVRAALEKRLKAFADRVRAAGAEGGPAAAAAPDAG